MTSIPVITAFEAVGRRAARIKVFLDGELWAELDAETVVREQLGRGQELSLARRAAILATDEAIRARKAAAGYNARQPRTRRELERYLREKAYSSAAIAAALDHLAASGTLADERVAARVISRRRRKADTGPRRLTAELRARGLSDELIETQTAAVLRDVDFKAECLALARKVQKKYEPLAEPRQRNKLLQFLLRRGYDSETARHALAQLAARD